MAYNVAGMSIPLVPSSLQANPELKELNMADRIFYLDPDATPIMTILNGLGREVTKTTEFKWVEDENYRMWAGDAKVTSLGYIATTSGIYYVGKLTLRRAIERQAFRESFYIGIKDHATEELYLGTGVTTNGAGNEAWKVSFPAGTLHSSEVVAYVMSPRFAEDNASVSGITYANVTAADRAVFSGLDSSKNKLPIINSRNEVYIIWSTSLGSDPASAYSNWNTSNYFPFETKSPTEQHGAYQQGSGLAGRSSKRTRYGWNQTEIIKTPYTISRTAKNEALWGGENEYIRQRTAAGSEHKIKFEKAFLFNTGATGRGTDTMTTSGLGIGWDGNASASGAYPLCVTKNGSYNTDFQWQVLGGTASAEIYLFALWDMIDAITEDSGVTDVNLMVSAYFNTLVNKLLAMTGQKDHLMDYGEDVAGISVKRLKTPSGDLMWSVNPSLRGPWKYYALSLHLDSFRIRPLTNSDTQLLLDQVKDGTDGQTDYYLTEMGFEGRDEHKQAIIKLVNAA